MILYIYLFIYTHIYIYIYIYIYIIDVKKVDNQLNVVYGTLRKNRCSRNLLLNFKLLLFIYIYLLIITINFNAKK